MSQRSQLQDSEHLDHTATVGALVTYTTQEMRLASLTRKPDSTTRPCMVDPAHRDAQFGVDRLQYPLMLGSGRRQSKRVVKAGGHSPTLSLSRR